jgi:hypothetical protein
MVGQVSFKLQGGRDLGETAGAFGDRIASDRHVTRVSDESRPGADTIHVKALVEASSRDQAQQRGKTILDAARSAAGKTIPDWSMTAWWCCHDVEESC